MIDAKLTPNYIRKPIDELISNVHSRTLLGLRLIENVGDLPIQTKEELESIQIFGNAKNTHDSKTDFNTWVLINGFEEINNSIRETLERTIVFLSIYDELQKSKLTLSQADEIEKELTTKVKKSHLPKILTNLESKIPLLYSKEISSINNARNSLIHDNGIVTKKRCNSLNGNHLEIYGIKLNLNFKHHLSNKIEPVFFGVKSPLNSSLVLNSKKFTLSFKIGERISIDYKNFANLLQTTLFIQSDILEKGKKYCTKPI